MRAALAVLAAFLAALLPTQAFADAFSSTPPPPALSGVSSQYYSGTGVFSVPSGAGSTGNIVGSGATVVGHGLCWSNTSATGAIDCGFVPLGATGNGSGLTGLLWSQIGSTPTTLAGYGISVTGSGVAVQATSPTLVSPALGTPSGIVLTNATGLSAAMDANFSSTQGSILYRGASAWVALGPGTSGLFLETLGAGANPTWAAASGGGGITALTGDVTASGSGSVAATLATVNADPGSVGSSTAIPVLTTNGKGLVTAQSTAAVIAPAGTLTGTTLASNVVTSSLTTVGTLGNLTLGGTLTAASLSTSGTIAGSICATSGGLILYEVGVNCISGGSGSLTVTDGTHSVAGTTTLTFGNGFLVGGSAGSATLNLTSPNRSVASGGATIGSGDLGGQVNSTDASAQTFAQPSTGTAGAGVSFTESNQAAGVVTLSGGQTLNGIAAASLNQYGWISCVGNSASADCIGNPGYLTITANALTKFNAANGSLTATGLSESGSALSTGDTITLTGTSAGTLVTCLGLTSANLVATAACGGGGGSGTVSSGAIGQIAVYAGTGTTVSGQTVASGVILKGQGAAVPVASAITDNGNTASIAEAALTPPGALTDGATIATNAFLSDAFSVTIAGNRTLSNPINLTAGQSIIWTITQDGTGSRTLAFGTAFNWLSGGAPLLNSAAGAKTVIACYADSTSTLQCSGGAPVNAQQSFACAVPLTTGVGSGTLTCFLKAARAFTVDNITATAVGTLVTVTPSLFECGTSTTCASPTTIGSGAVTAANTATPITVSSAAVAAGDYIAVELTAGTITSVAVNLQVEMH